MNGAKLKGVSDLRRKYQAGTVLFVTVNASRPPRLRTSISVRRHGSWCRCPDQPGTARERFARRVDAQYNEVSVLVRLHVHAGAVTADIDVVGEPDTNGGSLAAVEITVSGTRSEAASVAYVIRVLLAEFNCRTPSQTATTVPVARLRLPLCWQRLMAFCEHVASSPWTRASRQRERARRPGYADPPGDRPAPDASVTCTVWVGYANAHPAFRTTSMNARRRSSRAMRNAL